MLQPLIDSLRSKFPFLIKASRLDKPVGSVLLLWPTLWALWIAAEGFPGWHLLFVFCLGTLLTRSAGCIINDIADRKIDPHVKRTQQRPLATGELSVFDAIIFMIFLLFVSLLLVLSTNLATLLLAIPAVFFAGLYPFVKRVSHLPQVVLGLAFSFGIPMAFTAATNSIPLICWLIFLANLIWVVAYDTEYAMVDRDDDLKIGVGSTAILFGDLDRIMVAILQFFFIAIVLQLGNELIFDSYFYASVIAAAGLLIYQQVLIRNRQREKCLTAFLNNQWVGGVILLGILLQY
jgi:4-hydroxybenzoate polyprenyltransferase